MTYNFHTPLSSILLFPLLFISGCSVPLSPLAQARINGANTTDKQLLSALVDVAKAGAPVVCDPRALERMLDVSVAEPRKQFYGDSGSEEENAEVSTVPGQTAWHRGNYERFRSSSGNRCRIKLILNWPQLCEVSKARELAIPHSPPMAPRHGDMRNLDFSNIYFYKNPPDQSQHGVSAKDTIMRVETRTNSLCIYSVEITSDGPWQ